MKRSCSCFLQGCSRGDERSKKRQARMDSPKNLSIPFGSIEGGNQQLLYFNALDISASSVPYFFTFLSYFLLSKKRPRIIVKSE